MGIEISIPVGGISDEQVQRAKEAREATESTWKVVDIYNGKEKKVDSKVKIPKMKLDEVVVVAPVPMTVLEAAKLTKEAHKQKNKK